MATSTNHTARVGINARLAIGPATATSYSTSDFTAVAGVLSVNPSLDCEEVDVTPITSTGFTTYIAGKRSATLSFELAFDHQNTGHHLLLTQQAAGATNYYQINMPGDVSGTTLSSTWIARAFITSMSPTIDPGDKHGSTVSLRLTEAMTTPTN